ncbi:MAG: tetratricopeptide repeat protein [Saprospiraceae bacterium]|nr:tetratricopeptide repeat protein [Saprospiraceae bacterium]
MKEEKKTKTKQTKPVAQNELVRGATSFFESRIQITRLLPALAIALTFIGYIPSLSAEFVNWDDQDYASNNPLIHNFSNFLKFFTTPVQGNYHPLTMISLAFNYAISGLNPFSYHLVNVLFHLANVFLVFKFINGLLPGKIFIAFSVALFFGVHPMHVESVAWVSERKDVLYTFFFLLGFIQYLKYIDLNSKRNYWYCFLFFCLSIMSKPAAIIFPAVLFTLDFYRNRPFSFSIIKDKIPFGLIAAFFLYLTLHAQTSAGATPTSEFYTWDTRIFFPFYGYMMYIYKMFLPIGLTAFYPLPPINEGLKTAYYIGPIVFLLSSYWSYKTWKQNREVTFGFAFYLVNLFLVLQLFLVGSAIIAERYTYVPYIGLFFVFSWCLEKMLSQKKNLAYGLVIGAGLICTGLTYKHATTWQNTGSLWDNAIRSYPGAKAYTNRAYLYQQQGQLEKALQHYQTSLKYNVIDAEVYYNMGVIYFNLNKDSFALTSYGTALQYKPEYEEAFNGRGSVYARMGQHEKAYADFNKCLSLDPNYALAYKNRASSYFIENKYDSAIVDYKRYIALNKSDVEGVSNLCVVYLNKGDNEEAIKICDQAIQQDPKFAKAYTNAGAAYINLNNFPKAIEYLSKSFTLDSISEENLKFLSLAYLKNGDTTKAYSIFEYAQKLKAR